MTGLKKEPNRFLLAFYIHRRNVPFCYRFCKCFQMLGNPFDEEFCLGETSYHIRCMGVSLLLVMLSCVGNLTFVDSTAMVVLELVVL